MIACRLTLLGGFALEAADSGRMNLPTRKDRLLLAYLALSGGRPQPRERLAGLLWADRAEAQARDSLKQALADIRHAFRQAGLDPVRADRESVTFAPEGVEIDAVSFATLATAAKPSVRAALLYVGDLLEGTDGVTVEYDEWLRGERQRLGDLAVRVLDELTLSSTSADEALQLGRRLLSRDRLREAVYRSVMRLHAQRGERTEALKLYTTCRDYLKQDLGIAPDASTEELYRDILTDRLTSRSTPANFDQPAARPSIAVLPFTNISGDDKLGHLCDGMTEDVITGLGRFRLLFVIDRHSSAAVSKHSSDMADIARRLGVTYLVQGSLQRLGEQVRITVRLVEAGRRTQLWGESYDVPLGEVLTVPDRVTGAIVATLHGRVESAVFEQSRRKPTLEAYECVVRGIRHLRGYGPDDNKRALDLFQQAMDLDPDYALARAYRAVADVVVHGYGDAPDAVLAQALSLAASAVELDASDGQCHWILSIIHAYRGDRNSAERHSQRACALNPNDANAIIASGRLLARRGQYEDGIDRIREAMRLNPYHPEWYWTNLGSVLYSERKYADAAEAFGRVTRPGYWILCRIASCYAQLGRTSEAATAAAEARRLRPDFSPANLRLRECEPGEAEHIKEGLKKAGFE